VLESADGQQPAHPVRGQLGIEQQAGPVGQLEGPHQMGQRPAGVQPADHAETGLAAVQPGQEGDPGLVEEGRGTEEVHAELAG